MSRRGSMLLALLSCLLTVSCRDEPAPTAPEISAPQQVILDASRPGGAAGFFFLTPIVATDPTASGAFDGSLETRLAVEICTLSSAEGCTDPLLRRYTSTGPSYQESIRVNARREHYLVYWNTGAENVTPDPHYRIRILLDGVEVGRADVDVVQTDAELTAVDREHFAAVKKGDWLPIRFRIESGLASHVAPLVWRRTAFEALGAKEAELQGQGLTRAAYNQALAQWFASRPEFAASGVHGESSSVWARFTDGRLLIVANNRDAAPAGSASLSPSARPIARASSAAALARRSLPATAPGAAGRYAASRMPGFSARPSASVGETILIPRELPTSDQARLLLALPAAFSPDDYVVTQELANWLSTSGYRVEGGDNVGIDVLANVSGDAFFYMSTHGGVGLAASGEELYAVQTSVPLVFGAEATNPEQKNQADLDSGRLVYMWQDNGLRVDGRIVREPYYGITHRFVTQYMEFENSIVFINACASATAAAQAFANAILAKGADVYLGWTEEEVKIGASLRAAKYLLDRLLGAHEGVHWYSTYPEDPPQRPFDWFFVVQDMVREGDGVGVDLITGARLTAIPNPAKSALVGPLMPSIGYVYQEVDDAGAEFVVAEGTFGTDPGEGLRELTVGGQALEVTEWQPWAVTARLPANVRGDVVVNVRGHISNARPLSEWRGPLTYTLRDQGGLKVTMTMNLQTRMDLGLFRSAPAEAPWPWSKDGIFMHPGQLAYASYKGEGSHSWTENGCSVTEEWSGAGSVPAQPYDRSGSSSPMFHYYGRVDPQALTLEVLVYFTAAPFTRKNRRTCPDGQGGTYTTERTTIDVVSLPPELNDVDLHPGVPGMEMIRLPLNAQMHILAGTRSVQVPSRVGDGPAEGTLSWGTIVATPSYDRDTQVH